MVLFTKTLKFMSTTVWIETKFKQRQTFLFWWRNYAININLIVGSYGIASIQTLNFMSATVYEINRGNQHSNKEKYPYSEEANTQ